MAVDTHKREPPLTLELTEPGQSPTGPVELLRTNQCDNYYPFNKQQANDSAFFAPNTKLSLSLHQYHHRSCYLLPTGL